MDALSFFLLGLVQGLTEFLPVSSTGHLILARELFDVSDTNGLAVDAVLQLATALAVLVYFREDLFTLATATLRWLLGVVPDRTARNLILALVFGSLPACILGLLLEPYMEDAFRSDLVVAGALLAGSTLMFFAERYAKKVLVFGTDVSPKKGFLIGCFQALALIPGISRSGVTISGGLLLGLSREGAARFAFLLSFPIIAGSGLIKLVELLKEGEASVSLPALGAGFLVSFLVGLAAIHWLLRYLRTHSLMPFIVYRVVLAFVILIIAHL